MSTATAAVCAAVLLGALAACVASTTDIAVDDIYTPVLKVGVYYEALCPDSVHFIRQHLYPSMVVDGWLQYADVQLVPYGKVAKWTNPVTGFTMLTCQHGTAECELNALHGCIVKHHPVLDQLHLINCLMSRQSATLDECAQQFKINVQHSKQCKVTRTVADILSQYGVLTDALDISFVPTITIDEYFNRSQQQRLNHNFRETFRAEYGKKFGLTIELK